MKTKYPMMIILKLCLALLLSTAVSMNAQEFIVTDFESGFTGISGTNGNEDGLTTDSEMFRIVTNPERTGINTTENVGRFTRVVDGSWWAYARFVFDTIQITTVPQYLHLAIRKPVVSTVCIQLKDRHSSASSNTGELKSNEQTKTDEWQDLVFEINTPGDYCYMEVKPDFVNAAVSSRLDEDIDIFFDEIVINNDPNPRVLTEEAMFNYPLPTGTAGETPLEETFAAADTIERIVPGPLSYTENLNFDFNYASGYFRPYGWPEGTYDETRYVEFRITPDAYTSIAISKLQLRQKANTATLGPQKLKVAISYDEGASFIDVTDLTLARTAFSEDEITVNGKATTEPVIFRFYGFESLLGTEFQKDLWIIDYINVFGTVSPVFMNPLVSTQDVSDIGATEATLNGTVSDFGSNEITAHGICLNTEGMPDLNDAVSDLGVLEATGTFSLVINELSPVTTYYARAYATSAAGTSYGEEVSFSTLKGTQLINFGALNNTIYGRDTIALSATSTSGLKVFFASSDNNIAICTGQQGDSLVLVNAGTVNITASQPGDDSYVAADPVVQSLTIDPRTLTVTAVDTSRLEGESNPEFRITYDNFAGGEGTADLDQLPVASCNADESSTPGDYTIDVSGGSDPNYSFEYVTGTLTVNPVTNVAGIHGSSIRFYPNPTRGLLIVEIPDSKSHHISLCTVSGQKIMSIEASGKTSMDLSGLAKGNYLLLISSEGMVSKELITLQ